MRQGWMPVAVVMMALAGCGSEAAKVQAEFAEAQNESARLQARQLAEAFLLWQMEHRGACPSSIDELLPLSGRKDARDPWGNDYQLLCGDAVPAEAGDVGVVVRSRGRDGKAGTDDDVSSL